MKQLLGWMHRKFRQNSGEPFVIGCSCLAKQPSLEEEQNFYIPIHTTSKPSKQHPWNENLLRKSFAGSLDSLRIEEEDEDEYYVNEENTIFEISDFFDGLLTIGTLGSDNPMNTEPVTPTFFVSAGKQTELTEDDLKLINEELEKVFNEDTKDDNKYGNNESSSARTSYGSTITLSGNDNQVITGRGSNEVCPLQGYLFGSPIDLPAERVRKEHRTSLGELFQKSKIEEEEEKSENIEDKSNKQKSMKKFLKWCLLRCSTTTTATTADSLSAENKLQKLLQIFSRKVHPETTDTKKSLKLHKKETKNRDHYSSMDRTHIMFPNRGPTQRESTIIEDCLGRYNSRLNPPPIELTGNDSGGNREYWIKTDADYVVLEL